MVSSVGLDGGAEGLRMNQREPKLGERRPAFYAKGGRPSAGLERKKIKKMGVVSLFRLGEKIRFRVSWLPLFCLKIVPPLHMVGGSLI